jgi:hypothetical protein
VTRKTSLEARIENDDFRSLDLTVPYRKPAGGLTTGGGFDECGATTGVGSSMRSPGFVKARAARAVEALLEPFDLEFVISAA